MEILNSNNFSPKSFFLEDTSSKCYRDITNLFSINNWKKVGYKKRSKLEKKRFLHKEIPLFIWTLNEKNIDFNDLYDFQVCNHFEGIDYITTKRGFCDSLNHFANICENPLEIAPRSFYLGDSFQRDEFIDDFRISSALSILKWYVIVHDSVLHYLTDENENIEELDPKILQLAIYATIWNLRVNYYGEWPEVDISKYFRDKTHSLSFEQWKELLEESYRLNEIHLEVSFQTQMDIIDLKNSSHLDFRTQKFSPLLLKVKTILFLHSKINSQYMINGIRNIWVEKSPDSSCGIGIRLHDNLAEILHSEQGMGGRVVQKYIETPLLSIYSVKQRPASNLNKFPNPITQEDHPIQSSISFKLKFDIRIWVLVTCFEPLKFYIYNICYGRRSSRPYYCHTSTISDLNIHLTNYSVQRKNSAKENEAEPPNENNSAKKLRNICKSYRPSSTKLDIDVQSSKPFSFKTRLPDSGPECSEEDLLIEQNEIMEVLFDRYKDIVGEKKSRPDQGTFLNSYLSLPIQQFLKNRFQSPQELWAVVWNEIKRKISLVLQSAGDNVSNRANSFEFLGFDVIFDQLLVPWILEVNMSPAMAHRNEKQSQLIASMSEGLVEILFDEYSNPQKTKFFHTFQKLREEFDFNLMSAPDQIGRWEQVNSIQSLPVYTIDNNPGFKEEKNDPSTFIKGEDEFIKNLNNITPRTQTIASGDLLTCEKEISDIDQSEWQEVCDGNSFRKSIFNLRRQPPGKSKRPKSANSTRRKTSATSTNQLDSSFVLQARSISTNQIEKIDFFFKLLDSSILIQRWFRKVIRRVRNYYAHMNKSALKIQCCARILLARKNAQKRLALISIVRIQSWVRMLLATHLKMSLFKETQARKIQSIYRMHLSIQLYEKLKKLKSIRKIIEFYRKVKKSYQSKAANVIKWALKKWVKRLHLNASKLQSFFKRLVLIHKLKKKILKRLFYKWQYRFKILVHVKKGKLKHLANQASKKALKMHQQLILKKERDSQILEMENMKLEESRLCSMIKFDVVEYILWDVLFPSIHHNINIIEIRNAKPRNKNSRSKQTKSVTKQREEIIHNDIISLDNISVGTSTSSVSVDFPSAGLDIIEPSIIGRNNEIDSECKIYNEDIDSIEAFLAINFTESRSQNRPQQNRLPARGGEYSIKDFINKYDSKEEEVGQSKPVSIKRTQVIREDDELNWFVLRDFSNEEIPIKKDSKHHPDNFKINRSTQNAELNNFLEFKNPLPVAPFPDALNYRYPPINDHLSYHSSTTNPELISYSNRSHPLSLESHLQQCNSLRYLKKNGKYSEIHPSNFHEDNSNAVNNELLSSLEFNEYEVNEASYRISKGLTKSKDKNQKKRNDSFSQAIPSYLFRNDLGTSSHRRPRSANRSSTGKQSKKTRPSSANSISKRKN